VLELAEEAHVTGVEVYQASFVHASKSDDGLLAGHAAAGPLDHALGKRLVHELPLLLFHVKALNRRLSLAVTSHHLHPRFVWRERYCALGPRVAHVRLAYPLLTRYLEAPYFFGCLILLRCLILLHKSPETLNLFVSW